MPTVLVTGGLGFVGARVCSLLTSRGYEVVCVDHLSADYSPGAGHDAARRLRANGSACVLIEDLELTDLDRVLEPADAVVHLAALPGVRAGHDRATLWRANVTLTERVARAAARNGTRMVLASSSSVYGNAAVMPTPETARPRPLGGYALSKLAAEKASLAAGAEVVVARLFTVFGPGQRPDMAVSRWIGALRSGEAVEMHLHGAGSRELTHVDDAARGLVAALERGRPGETYNVAGCGPTRMERVLGLLERELGRRARIRRSAPSPAEAVSTAACPTKSARELGYRPRVPLLAGIRGQLASVDALGEQRVEDPRQLRHVRQLSVGLGFR
jgi:UDP-glucuronate 4-epimerase